MEDSATSSFASQITPVLDKMTLSVSDTRKALHTLLQKKDTPDLDIKDGISLLALKHQMMLGYIHALALLSAHRVLGHSLSARSPPASFQDPDRGSRGGEAGDLVDYLIEKRLVLEKSKALEARMQYQVEKLVRSALEPLPTNDVEDPLSFRPNPDNLIQANESAQSESEARNKDGLYRPPKVAPMPYNESADKKRRRSRAPAALSSLAYENANGPHAESTSGLGGAGNRGINAMSSRARELARMTEFEENNMTRLVMSKKEAKRRRQDEETIALGGSGIGANTGRGRARGAGFADEFGDLLRNRDSGRGMVDAYDDLRARSNKKSAFERSKARESLDDPYINEERPRKRSRFHQEVKRVKRRQE